MVLKKKGIEDHIIVGLAMLFAIILGTIIITINKGFDFTDEGGFLLSYKNTEIYRGGIYNYHIIIHKLTNWFNPGILSFRWMSLLITLLSSYVLTLGLCRWMKAYLKKDHIFKRFSFLFFFISIGNFLFYFPGLLTIYNNTLTNFLLQVSTGLILYFFSKNASKNLQLRKSFLALALLGLLCAISFFIKFPTGILQIVAYILILFCYLNEIGFMKRLVIISIFSLGVTMGALLYFIVFQGSNEWYTNFLKEYNILSDHSSTILLKSYILEFLALITFSLKNFSWLLIFPLVIIFQKYFHLSFRSGKLRVFRNLFIFLSTVVFLVQGYYFGFYRSMFANEAWINAYFYIIIIALQIFFIFAFLLKKKVKIRELIIRRSEEIQIILLLLVTPFIGAFGTANSIFANSLIHSATWFGVIVILIYYLSNFLNRKVFIPLFIIIPGVVTASQIVDGNIFSPYYSVFNQNKSNFFDQTEQVKDIPLLDGIYVDNKTRKFLIELKELLNESNYKKGDPIMGFHMPGVIYLVEGISPAVPYYYNKDRDVKALESLYDKNQPPIIMLTRENPIKDEIIDILQTKGIYFPDDYIKKGEVYFPNDDSLLEVYFPKNY